MLELVAQVKKLSNGSDLLLVADILSIKTHRCLPGYFFFLMIFFFMIFL